MIQHPYESSYVIPASPIPSGPSPYMNSYEPVLFPVERYPMPSIPQSQLVQSVPTHPGEAERNNVSYKRQQLLMEEAIQRAREQVYGLVIEAKLERKHDRQIFEIEIIDQQNNKYEVEIDANTGAVIDISLD